MTTADVADTDPLIGNRIDGRYTVHRVLGAGGMGVVYEGVHDELGRTVAIKVLNAAWASDRTAVERFLREARTASSFAHPNIVDVTDLGRLPDGRPFLVMPKVAGVDLATLLGETGPQPAKRVAALLSGVAAALDLVHAKGFVHRDIKPENLMYVVREDASETVMLLDFGIAAAVMSSGPRLTRQGAIFGTPHYLPPEVCAGGRPDARGDVYALAAVAYELITGALPFPLEDIMQLMAYKVTNDAPSLADATGFEFPAELERVIARGLAREPSQRFPSASAFVVAFRGATAHAPVSWQSGVLRSTMRSDEHFVSRERPWVEHAPTMPSEPVRGTPGSGALRPGDRDEPEYRAPSAGYAPERVATGGRAPSAGRAFTPSGGRGFTPDGNRGFTPSGGRAYEREPSGPGFEREAGSARYPRDFGDESSQTRRDPGFDRGRSGSRGYSQPYGGANEAEYTQSLRVVDERRYPTASVPMNPPWGRYLLYFAAAAGVVMALMQLKTSKQHSAVATTQSPATTREPAPAAQPPRAAATTGATGATATTGTTVAPAATSRAVTTGSAAAAPGAALAASAAPATTPSVASATSGAPTAVAPAFAATKHDAPAALTTTAPAAPTVQAKASQPSAAAKSSEPRPSSMPSFEPPPEPAAPPAEPRPVVTLKQEEEPPPTAAAPKPAPAPAPDDAEVGAARATQLTRDASTALLRGEVGRAVELSRAATVSDEDNSRAWRTLGLALERTGSSREAVAAYKRYLLLSPTGPEADMVRQRIQALGR